MKNQEAIPLPGEGEGPIGRLGTGLQGIRMKAAEALCLADARSRTFLEGSDEGMATAEYAIVLVAATGFAGLVVGMALVMKDSWAANAWPQALVTRGLTLGSAAVSTSGDLDAAGVATLLHHATDRLTLSF